MSLCFLLQLIKCYTFDDSCYITEKHLIHSENIKKIIKSISTWIKIIIDPISHLKPSKSTRLASSSIGFGQKWFHAACIGSQKQLLILLDTTFRSHFNHVLFNVKKGR